MKGTFSFWFSIFALLIATFALAHNIYFYQKTKKLYKKPTSFWENPDSIKVIDDTTHLYYSKNPIRMYDYENGWEYVIHPDRTIDTFSLGPLYGNVDYPNWIIKVSGKIIRPKASL